MRENKKPSVCGRLAPKFKREGGKKKKRPKDSQLFLKWWLATQADAGIHSIAWENRSGAEHHFLTVKLFFVVEKRKQDEVTAAPDQAGGFQFFFFFKNQGMHREREGKKQFVP